MSDKISGFTVVFDDAVSEEYMETVKQMVYSIKHVSKIDTVIQGSGQYIGEMKERARIINSLIESIKKEFKND